MSYDYAEKLRDPRWQKKRLEIMQRDGFKCHWCSHDDKTLQIHHLWYKGEPWETPSEALETLCEDCHGIRTLFDEFYKAFTNKRCRVPTYLVFGFLGFYSPALKGENAFLLEKRRWSLMEVLARVHHFYDDRAAAKGRQPKSAESTQEDAISQFLSILDINPPKPTDTAATLSQCEPSNKRGSLNTHTDAGSVTTGPTVRSNSPSAALADFSAAAECRESEKLPVTAS